jgi:beta-1,4-mannosyl-glycoprotein beta-1,4-N-acetylglucosaminyltransferase
MRALIAHARRAPSKLVSSAAVAGGQHATYLFSLVLLLLALLLASALYYHAPGPFQHLAARGRSIVRPAGVIDVEHPLTSSEIRAQEERWALDPHTPLSAYAELHAPPFDASTVNCSTYGWTRRERPAGIVDGVLFGGESDVLSVRLAELDGVVDVFLLLEATLTFAHARKPAYFDQLLKHEYLPEWGGQLRSFVLTELPPGTGPLWPTEHAIRDAKLDVFEELLRSAPELRGRDPSEVFLVISDVDELPCAAKLATLKFCGVPHDELPAAMALEHFHYYSFRWAKRSAWRGAPNAAPGDLILSGAFSRGSEGRLHKKRVHPAWEHCGWHLSYFMSPARVALKLRSFSHAEYDKPPYNTLPWIMERMRQGEDLFGREGEDMVPASPDPLEAEADLPRLVAANKALFRRWLHPDGWDAPPKP